jgi:hypothetical protein
VAVSLQPIADVDVSRVAAFLAENMGSGVSAASWARSFDIHRDVTHPNNGFMLLDGDRVVGVYAAYYSERLIDGRVESICNLGAWCVLPDHRFQGVRLVRALVGQPGHHFVDLSPSGSVVPLNERLGFVHLDDRLGVLPALPWPHRHGTVSSRPEVLERALRGRDLGLYRDHRTAEAARHVVIREGGESCYVVFRMDRRKGLPRVFASILHVSEPALFHRHRRAVAAHLLLRHGALALLVEERLIGAPLAGAARIRSPRKKMFLSPTLRAEQVDYFYSELVSVSW